MGGKVFSMSEFLEGTTAPPFHVKCRSITIPYFNDEFTAEKILVAKGKDEKTYHVPSDMTYEDWKKGFIDGDKSGIIDSKEVAYTMAVKSEPKITEAIVNTASKVDAKIEGLEFRLKTKESYNRTIVKS